MVGKEIGRWEGPPQAHTMERLLYLVQDSRELAGWDHEATGSAVAGQALFVWSP